MFKALESDSDSDSDENPESELNFSLFLTALDEKIIDWNDVIYIIKRFKRKAYIKKALIMLQRWNVNYETDKKITECNIKVLEDMIKHINKCSSLYR